LQQLWEAVRREQERRSSKEPTTSATREEGATTSYLSDITIVHRVLNIPPDEIDFPTPNMQEKALVLSHMDLVISQIPIGALEGL
jgi:hypothetical protein